MATSKWKDIPTSGGTVLSTQLDGLAAGFACTAGAVVDNRTARAMLAYLVFEGAFGSSPSDGGYLEVYLVPAIDGTNYVDRSANQLVCSIPVATGTGSQRLVSPLVMIPPTNMKFVIVNQADQALAGSGNTLKLYTVNESLE